MAETIEVENGLGLIGENSSSIIEQTEKVIGDFKEAHRLSKDPKVF